MQLQQQQQREQRMTCTVYQHLFSLPPRCILVYRFGARGYQKGFQRWIKKVVGRLCFGIKARLQIEPHLMAKKKVR